MHSAYGLLQLRDTDELRGRQRPHGDDQLRFQEADLAIEMSAAVRNLGGIGNAVTATLRVLAGKTADDRADVNARSEVLLGDSETVGEPSEHPASGGVGEWTAVQNLMWARSLADQHHASACDGAGYRLTEDVRTGAAGAQQGQMFIE